MKINALIASSLVLFASPALSADRQTSRPVRVYLSAPVWNGAYLSLQTGYAFVSTPLRLYADGPPYIAYDDINPKGFSYGVSAGYDWQFNSLVLGLSADAELSSIKRTRREVSVGSLLIPAPGEVNLARQASLRARLGYLIVPDLMLYATGGAGFSTLELLTAFPAPNANAQTLNGWTAGAGAAYALTRKLSVSAEYRYTGFGRFKRPVSPPFLARTDLDAQSLRLGLSYRFGG